tara:strand:- start:4222 stop:5259 length:1038 start_codon:yes stop_codon:yes gene_type:complete
MNTSITALPFEDIRELIRSLPGPVTEAVEAVRARDAMLTKPAGSLGRLEELVEWLAAWQGKAPPAVTRPLVAIFAGNHGIAELGVSAFPASVTQQMVENFAAGGAAINQLCTVNNLGLKVFDLALDLPTPDITLKDAFDEKTCAATMAFGMEAIAGGTDLLCIGEMGIANTTVAAAIFHALYGGRPEDWVGAGTGVDAAGLKRKADVVRRAVGRAGVSKTNGLEALRRLGGREIAAMCGAMLAARVERIPVIVDGFVATASAAILHSVSPASIDHCLFSHVSDEQAHAAVLKRLGKRPLLDLGMRLGEGSGAAIAAGIVKSAAAVHSGMATFDQAGVSVSDVETD